MRAGNLIVQHNGQEWQAIKILEVDRWQDGSSVAHCLVYQATLSKPTLTSLLETPIQVWHTPIDARSFDQGWELIGNKQPAGDELDGFIEYLKRTDFRRYVAFTGQDTREIVRVASDHYRRACALDDAGNKLEAIADYSSAIDLFPLFFEALDNRAFTYMDLGMYKEALDDFEESLRVNPGGETAFFSRGTCLMQLGDLKAAEAIFEECLSRFPANANLFAPFLERARALQNGT